MNRTSGGFLISDGRMKGAKESKLEEDKLVCGEGSEGIS